MPELTQDQADQWMSCRRRSVQLMAEMSVFVGDVTPAAQQFQKTINTFLEEMDFLTWQLSAKAIGQEERPRPSRPGGL